MPLSWALEVMVSAFRMAVLLLLRLAIRVDAGPSPLKPVEPALLGPSVVCSRFTAKVSDVMSAEVRFLILSVRGRTGWGS